MHVLMFDYFQHRARLDEDLKKNKQSSIKSQWFNWLFSHVNIGDSINWTSLSTSIRKSTVTSISELKEKNEYNSKDFN